MPARTSRPPPEECANCGAAIPRNAKSCPGCGADERTGWRETEDSIYDGLDLPEADRETRPPGARGDRSDRNVNGLAWYWWCVGVALVVIIVLYALRLAGPPLF